MLRQATKLSVVSLALAIAAVIGSAPADAASTRAEYIAQADPICQQFVGPENAAFSAYNRNMKRWVHALYKGSLRAWVKQTKRTVASLRQYEQVHSAMTEQVAAVQPTTTDAGLITSWLNGRRQADVTAMAAASALSRFQLERFDRLVRQANNAEAAGLQAIDGFGFTVCGVYA